MANFIKALEPKKWHSEESKIEALKEYKIPKQLLEILRSENRRFEIQGNDYCGYIIFASLLSIKEVTWKKYTFLDLLMEVDNFGADGFLVWYPTKKCLAFADYEHGKFKELCSVREFFKNPSKQINKIWQ